MLYNHLQYRKMQLTIIHQNKYARMWKVERKYITLYNFIVTDNHHT